MKLTAGRTSPESLEETRLALDARTASHANCTSRESGEHDPAEGGMPLWTSRTPRAPGRVPVAPKVFQRRPATHQNQEDHSSAISQIEGTRALENAVERRGHCTSHHDRARHSHPAMAVSTEEIAKSMVLAKEGRHRRCHDHGFQQASSTTSSGSAAYSGDGVRQETCAPTLNSLAPYAAHVHLQPGQAGAPESRVCKPPSLNLPGRMEGPINLSSSQALTRLEPENSAAPPPLHNRLALPSSNLPMMPSPSNSLAVPQLWRVNGIAPHLGSAISAAFKPPTQMTFSVSNASFTRVQTNVRWNSNTGATSGSQSLQQVQRDAYGNMEMNSDYREFQWQ